MSVPLLMSKMGGMPDLQDLRRKAELFRQLHQGPRILVLPNAWDCASARLFEEAGFPAIATTSAGIAFTLGYPDGERISRDEMLAVAGRIAAAVSVPVTADVEAGYGDAAATAAGVIESGAVGLNLEDARGDGSLVDVGEQCERIRTVRRTGLRSGVHLVINARCDMYLNGIGEPADRFEGSIERLRRYVDAGADCLFVPGVTDAALISRLVEALQFPLNILAGPGAPPAPRLEALGVARLSVGSGIMRATMGLTRRIARELRGTGEYGSMTEAAVPYAEATRMFPSRADR